MMRLQRVGRKNDPSYRIVVTDKRTSPTGSTHVEHLGSFNPKSGDFQINEEKARYWLSQGVQASVTMHNMLVSKKIIEGKKINALSRKSPIVDEEAVKKAAEEKLASEKVATETEVTEETKEEVKA